MQEFRMQVQSVLDQYKDSLAARGVEILLNKRYVESAVQERSISNSFILDAIDRAADRKKELKNQYHYEPNKYHLLVLTLRPTQKGALPRARCREYAFLLRKRTRPHVGVAPEDRTYNQEKVLRRIEKTIVSVLEKAERQSPEALCRDTLADALRYTLMPKYSYKQTILGKDCFFWDILLSLALCASVLGVLLLCAGVRRLLS